MATKTIMMNGKRKEIGKQNTEKGCEYGGKGMEPSCSRWDSREAHIEWCKQRALEYVDRGDNDQAWASMTSDLTKHDETANHPAIDLGTVLMRAGLLNYASVMRKFIEGFN